MKFSVPLRVVLLIPVLVFIPMLVWQLDLPLFGHTYGRRYQVFEIFIFFVTISFIIFGSARMYKQEDKSLEFLLPELIFVLLGLYFVVQVCEYHPKSFDWMIREDAAKAIVDGKSPYVVSDYLYPPITAQVLALVYSGMEFGASVLGISATEEFLRQGMFYVFQAVQFFLVMIAYLLCFKFVQQLGVRDSTIGILLAIVFVFCMPLFRTIRHHQVNLWILDAMLVALLTFRHFPYVAGLALAIGTHIKLYPLIMLFPFVAMKSIRIVVWFIVALAAIFFLQTSAGTDLRFWHDFIAMIGQFPPGDQLRDNGLHSLIFNTVRYTNMMFGLDARLTTTITNLLVLVARIAVVVWFVYRFIQRERAFQATLLNDHEWQTRCRVLGHLLDTIPFILMASPMVWEHHYVIAIPFILWVITTQGMHKPWQVGIAAFLILAIPTFDVFPLSYHRLLGLCWLTLLSPPVMVPRPQFELKTFHFASR